MISASSVRAITLSTTWFVKARRIIWLTSAPARFRSFCCSASVPWVEMSCARWVSREPRMSAPTVTERCAVAFASANIAQPHCRCPVPSTASAATAGMGVAPGVKVDALSEVEVLAAGRRNGLAPGSITAKGRASVGYRRPATARGGPLDRLWLVSKSKLGPFSLELYSSTHVKCGRAIS